MGEQEANRLRASDADREQVAERLRQAISEGRLTLAEGDQRLAAVYAASYQDELPPITADLPPAEPAGDEPGADGTRGHADRRRRAPDRWTVWTGLAVVAAALAIGWAFADGPVWPAIVLGIVAGKALKHSRRRREPGNGPATGAYGQETAHRQGTARRPRCPGQEHRQPEPAAREPV